MDFSFKQRLNILPLKFLSKRNDKVAAASSFTRTFHLWNSFHLWKPFPASYSPVIYDVQKWKYNVNPHHASPWILFFLLSSQLILLYPTPCNMVAFTIFFVVSHLHHIIWYLLHKNIIFRLRLVTWKNKTVIFFLFKDRLCALLLELSVLFRAGAHFMVALVSNHSPMLGMFSSVPMITGTAISFRDFQNFIMQIVEIVDLLYFHFSFQIHNRKSFFLIF